VEEEGRRETIGDKDVYIRCLCPFNIHWMIECLLCVILSFCVTSLLGLYNNTKATVPSCFYSSLTPALTPEAGSCFDSMKSNLSPACHIHLCPPPAPTGSRAVILTSLTRLQQTTVVGFDFLCFAHSAHPPVLNNLPCLLAFWASLIICLQKPYLTYTSFTNARFVYSLWITIVIYLPH
jgi:hypothetical protein